MRISDWSSDVCSSDLQERLASKHGKYVPMLVKVAPDLSDDDIDAAARVLGDMRVDGVIATNTTVSRIAVQEDPLARDRRTVRRAADEQVHRGAADAAHEIGRAHV